MALEKGIPSVRLGKKLVDTIIDAGFKNMAEFEKFRLDRGLPAIGSAEVERQRYFKCNGARIKQYELLADTPEFTKVEIEQTKKNLNYQMIKNQHRNKEKVGDRIIKTVTEISDDADVFFGEKMSKRKRNL